MSASNSKVTFLRWLMSVIFSMSRAVFLLLGLIETGGLFLV
jgi:hypothetical protein